jgi:hypothetical protein
MGWQGGVAASWSFSIRNVSFHLTSCADYYFLSYSWARKILSPPFLYAKMNFWLLISIYNLINADSEMSGNFQQWKGNVTSFNYVVKKFSHSTQELGWEI